MYHPTDRIAHTTTFVITVVEHWMEEKIAKWVHLMESINDRSLHELHLAQRERERKRERERERYRERERDRDRQRERFYLTTHSTHFIYGYIASDYMRERERERERETERERE